MGAGNSRQNRAHLMRASALANGRAGLFPAASSWRTPHRSLVRRLVAVGRIWRLRPLAHIQGLSAGATGDRNIRRTTAPSSSTSYTQRMLEQLVPPDSSPACRGVPLIPFCWSAATTHRSTYDPRPQHEAAVAALCWKAQCRIDGVRIPIRRTRGQLDALD